jgi:hypothetical protein
MELYLNALYSYISCCLGREAPYNITFSLLPSLLPSLSLFLWLYSPLDLGRFVHFLILYAVSRTPWMGDQPIAKPLPSHRTTQTHNKSTQTSMPLLRF